MTPLPMTMMTDGGLTAGDEGVQQLLFGQTALHLHLHHLTRLTGCLLLGLT